MVGEVIADRYELEELCGTGGMSSVYRATDRLLERRVALKILHAAHHADPETLERFRREARAVAQLAHPNIVTVIDRGESGGRQYIVFEYVDGENLKRLIEREGPLPIPQALQLAIAVGGALAFAHERGIVHRDVKPQNVLLNGDGEPKVTDFGIARALGDGSVTQSGTILGTGSYVSPEQATGQPVGTATDVYSLGVVVYELLTGEVPFPGDSLVEVAMRHVHDAPPSVASRRPDVSARLAAAVERALAKDPDDRFPSMAAFVAELAACHGQPGADLEGENTLVVRSAKRPRPRSRRRLAVPLGVVAVCAAGAIAAVVALTGDADPGAVGAGSGSGTPVELSGLASHDPEGDDQEEHPERVRFATDGDPSTYWTTSTYRGDFSALKSGVGIVLDAGRPLQAERLTVVSDTPGFTAEVKAGSTPTAFPEQAASSQRVGSRTTFDLSLEQERRYYLVWITALPEGVARINEVEAD